MKVLLTKILLTAGLALMAALPAQAQLAVPNEAGITYGHVHLNVSDVEVHKQVWVEHFGGEPIERGPVVGVKLPNFILLLTERAPTDSTLP